MRRVRSVAQCNQRFSKENRLRRRQEFLEVQRHGRRVHTPHFVILVRPGPGQRLGITVTRRVAGAAGRNRVKRLVREVFRRNRCLFPLNSDVVMVARKGATALDYVSLCHELSQVQPTLLKAVSPGGAQSSHSARGCPQETR